VTLADSHIHFFRRGFPGPYGASLLRPDIDAYELLRAKHGIEAALIVGYEGLGIDPGNNAYIRDLAASRPWMATLGHIDDVTVASAADVGTLLEAGHAGIALYVPDPATAQAVAARPPGFWRMLDRAGAIVSFNARPEATGELGPLIAASPNCRFLFSHVGLPGPQPAVPTRQAAEARIAPLLALAPMQNVFVKISGLYAISVPEHAYPHAAAGPFIDAVVERFGAARCLWASDFPPALDLVSFAQTIDNPLLDGLAPAERDAVMGGNLLRLLGRAP